MRYTTYSYMASLACIKRDWGKMIHSLCYSHLIMINTLCTVQVRVQYTVHCTLVQYIVYHYFWARFNFIWGGLHTVQYSVYHYFLLGSILFGGLKPPQALMTRRPWLYVTLIRKLQRWKIGWCHSVITCVGDRLSLPTEWCSRSWTCATGTPDEGLRSMWISGVGTPGEKLLRSSRSLGRRPLASRDNPAQHRSGAW